MRETEALMMFKPRGLNPSRVDSAIHLCKADKLGGVRSRKGKKKPAFHYEKGLHLNDAYENALPPSPTPTEEGKNTVRKDVCIWNHYYNSFDEAKIKW